MASQPIDQGAILQSGRASIQDYAADQLRQQLANAQTQQANTQAQQVHAAISHQQQEQQRQAAYMQEIQAYQQAPTSQGLVNIMARYPEFSEGANRAFQAQDAQARDGDFRFAAEVDSAAQGGHYDVAASRMRERDAADTAAGHPPDPNHAAILADLDSGDPARQRAAADALSGLTAIMAGPERYAAVYNARHPQEALHEVNGILYNNAGVAVSQDPRGRVISGTNGAFYQEQPVAGIPMLGGGQSQPGAPQQPQPAAPAAPAAPVQTGNLPRDGQPMRTGMFQGWQVIGVPGDPRRRPGGVEVPHNGVDFRPPANNPHLAADRPLEVVSTMPDHGISGITAVVRFPDGAQFNLMHLANQPRPGHYDAGQVFATAGNTGNARNGSTQIHVQPWGGTRHDPRQYFGGGVGTTASPIRVRTQAQAQALPPGTIYTTPDNQTLRR